MVKRMGLEFLNKLTVSNMMVNGKMVNKTGMVLIQMSKVIKKLGYGNKVN